MGQAKGTGENQASPTPGSTSFGEQLKFLRRRAQLTQEELARAVGYSREQITKLENSQRAPDPTAVKALFLPALDLAPNSDLGAALLELAARAKGAGPGMRLVSPPRTNVTAPLTRLIGREREIAEIQHLLAETRLLALTGAGGVGKTRLAIAVGLASVAAYADGVWMTDLSPLNEQSLVAVSAAALFNLPPAQGRSALDALAEYARERELLLILDNCEHLLVACAQLAETLLRAAPRVRLLATSRESLGILSATTYPVPSLAVPTPGAPLERVRETDAVRLFVERAQASKAGFALTPENAGAIAEICRRLDGVPLAIELAATRVRSLSIQEIAENLSDRFRLLTRGDAAALPRHRTLRAMIDWSYDLLNASERALCRQIAVFAGGCAVDSLQAFAGAASLELAASLVDKSMLDADERHARTRYRLPETLREYALEKLEQEHEFTAARQRHLDYFVAFVETNDPRLRGPDQAEWYERFDLEQDNFRAALDWAVRSGDVSAGLRMIAPLWFYWFWRGHWVEGSRLSRAVLEMTAEADPQRSLTEPKTLGADAKLKARALIGASNLVGRLGDYETYGRWLGEGTALAVRVGDAEAVAWARLHATFGVRDSAEAEALLEQALEYARRAGDEWFQAEILHVWGERVHGRGDLARAEELFGESERLFRRRGDPDRVALLKGNLGMLAYERGEYDRAQSAYAASLAHARERNDSPGEANWLLAIARLALKENDPARVMDALAGCLPTFLEISDQEALVDGFVIAADLANGEHQSERAAALLGAGDKLLEQYNLLHQVVSPTKGNEFTRAVEGTRARLGPAAFEAAWEAGRARSQSEAVEYALESPGRCVE